MKLTKLSKKIIAIVSAFAMVVAGIAYSPETTYAASATVDGYTYTVENGPGTSWTGIVVQGIFDNQRIHFAWGIDVDPSSIAVSVNGQNITSVGGTNAKGCFIYLTDARDAVNSVAGDYDITLTASYQDTDYTWPASFKLEGNGETQAPTADQDGYMKLDDGKETSVGDWILYAGTWANGQMSYKDVDDDSVDLKLLASPNNLAGDNKWALQAKYTLSGLDASKTYTFSTSYNTSNSGDMFIKLEGVDEGTSIESAVGDNNYSIEFTGKTSVVVVYSLAGFAQGTTIDINSVSATEKQTESTEAPTESTQAPTESTQAPTESTQAPTESTQAPTVVPSESSDIDPYAGLTWTQVGNTTYYVAAGNDGFPFQEVTDAGTQIKLIPSVAAGDKPIWPDFTDATLNGNTFAQPAGAGIYINYSDLNKNAYNIYEATSAVTNDRFQIIIKEGNPSGGDVTESQSQSESSSETSAEATQKDAPVGFVCQFIDDDVYIAWGVYATAKLYVDGEEYAGNPIVNGVHIPKSAFSVGTHSFAIAGITDDSYGETKKTTAVDLVFEAPEGTMDVSEYKANGTYPTEEGKVFAGWYADAEFTTPYMETTGNAYPKFIDKNVLAGAYQLNNETAPTAIRFLSTIDCKDYQEIGFILSGSYGGTEISNVKKSVKNIYKNVLAGGQTVTPTSEPFSSESTWLYTYTLRQIDTSKTLTMDYTPYFITADGTQVQGATCHYPSSN